MRKNSSSFFLIVLFGVLFIVLFSSASPGNILNSFTIFLSQSFSGMLSGDTIVGIGALILIVIISAMLIFSGSTVRR